MKLFLTLATILFLFSSVAFAAPFLVCDPPPAEQEVTSYEVYIDGALVATVPAETDGSLRYDLSGVQPGQYTFTAKAVNVWGASDPANPCFSPAVSTQPAGLKLLP